MTDKTQIGRLAMREENGFWNAYYALTDTMEGAVLLGSVSLGIVVDKPDRRRIFIDLMREAVSDIIETKVGVRPTWGGERAAPFWEKRSHG